MNKTPFRFYHKVGRSYYPLWTTLSLGCLFSSFVMWAHYGIWFGVLIGVVALTLNILMWGDTVCMEAMAGNHLNHMQMALKFSFSLFLLSEGMFFFSIFWLFFDSAMNPSIEIGGEWPAVGISPINPYGIPLLNTVLLLSSGITATCSHHNLLQKQNASIMLIFTIVLAMIFVFVQYIEYTNATFSMSDGIFGSIFFFGTGFHGLHVIFGTLFLMFNLYRMIKYHFTSTRHISFECALIYWHFVDVIWVLLYVFFYWWSY